MAPKDASSMTVKQLQAALKKKKVDFDKKAKKAELIELYESVSFTVESVSSNDVFSLGLPSSRGFLSADSVPAYLLAPTTRDSSWSWAGFGERRGEMREESFAFSLVDRVRKTRMRRRRRRRRNGDLTSNRSHKKNNPVRPGLQGPDARG